MKRKFTGNFICPKHVLPNVGFIAFTRIPRLKSSETVSRFSEIIHAYTIQQPVSDRKAPRDCIDYVIVDELCSLKKHKIIARHSAHFWNA